MKEQLQGKLVEILTSIQTTVGKASDFAMEQLPDIAMQYIHFKMTWYCVEIVLFSALTIYLWKLGTRCWKVWDTKGDGDYGFCWFISRAGAIITSFVVVYNLYYSLMILIAPKIWFIYQMVDMVKGIK